MARKRKSINPRKYRHQVIVQEPDYSSVDAGGNPLTTWTDRGIRWCRIESKRFMEFEVMDQTQAIQSHFIEMPSDSLTRQITSAWRLKKKYGGEVFNIIGGGDSDYEEIEVILHASIHEGSAA